MNSFQVSGQLAAAFTSDTVQGCAPLVVKFTDLSTGNPSSWRWEMGDGNVLFVKNPATTYFQAGTYSVKLIISNGSGADSVIKTSYIKVYEVPQVNFKASDTTGCFPLSVQFTDLSVPMSGTIESREWDFGDGSSSDKINPVHIYENPGIYNVSLRVRNSNGCVKTLTRLRYISILQGVKAGFEFSSPNSCDPPTAVGFTNTSTGTGTISYQWDFGDGSESTDKSPVHRYTAAGLYNVQLTIRNNSGCVDTFLAPAPLVIGETKADFDIPQQICAGQSFIISNRSVPAPTSSRWIFSDGSNLSGNEPVKSFNTAGIYTIKLVSNFGACNDSITKTITVIDKPNGDFNTSQTRTCKNTLDVAFTPSVNGAVSYQWEFGDGSISASSNPSHTYSGYGEYSVMMITKNTAGCTDTIIKEKLIRLSEPEISLKNLPSEGCAPLTVQPASDVISEDSILTYNWDFGNGSSSSQKQPSYVYTVPGVYDVILRFTTAGGCSDSVVMRNAVRVGQKPDISFLANPNIACAFQPVSFTDNSSNPKPDEWEWHFGDGGISNEQDPVYNYQDTGRFTVKLIVTSNGCSDSLSIPAMVTIKPPIARFVDSFPDCNNQFKRYFIDHSIGATSWFWDFGDGETSNAQNPEHVYQKSGAYIVKLTVKNDTCENTAYRQVLIVSGTADFTVSDTAVCKNTNVQFTSVSDVGISNFTWYFGDGSTASGFSVNHVYAGAGLYDIRLSVTDIFGCTDTLLKPLLIRVNGPTAFFSNTNTPVCYNVPVLFSDESTSDGLNVIVKRNWNFGDGNTESSSGDSTSHSYLKAGTYFVSLTLEDELGCTDQFTSGMAIHISKPSPEFSTSDSASCTSKDIRFVNYSSGNQPVYTWFFGDGTTSHEIQPVHKYMNEADYAVTLSATDRFGCTDSLIKPLFVRIGNPVAHFTVSDSVATCPPLVVDFKNQSKNMVNFTWDFGDGTNTQNDDPGHFYTFPGRYRSTLTITSAGGCIDSFSRDIVVRGPQGDFTYKTFSGCTPAEITFSGSTKDNASFVWDFNDGEVENGDSIISHTYSRPGTYLPKMILVDPGGCRVPIVGKDTIHVYGVDAAFGINNTVFCDSATIFLTDSSISNEPVTSYLWQLGDGTTSNLKNPVHSFRNPGEYLVHLSVKTSSGCTDTISMRTPVKIAESPVAVIKPVDDACIPVQVSFEADIRRSGGETLAFNWNFGNGTTSQEQNPDPVGFERAGTYSTRLDIINNYGCKTSVSQIFEAYPLPGIKASGDPVICEGQLADLSATGASFYTWSPALLLSCTNCTTPKAAPLERTSFYVVGENQFGCTSTDSLVIDVKKPFVVKVEPGDTICRGESVQLKATGAELYAWTPEHGLSDRSIADPLARPDSTIVYRVTGSDDAGCFFDTAFVPVVVYPFPTIDAGEDKNVAVGDQVTLNTTITGEPVSIKWMPPGWLDCSDCPNPVATPKQSVTYQVQVVNDGGCIGRDEINLHVFCDNSNLFLPNTFSPNHDGRNDIFYPEGKGLFSIKTLRIFNRWGEVVFERTNFKANDSSKGWSGFYKGMAAPQDVYVYTVEVICENQVVLHYKGNVALVR